MTQLPDIAVEVDVQGGEMEERCLSANLWHLQKYAHFYCPHFAHGEGETETFTALSIPRPHGRAWWWSSHGSGDHQGKKCPRNPPAPSKAAPHASHSL